VRVLVSPPDILALMDVLKILKAILAVHDREPGRAMSLWRCG